jgi:prepilin-type processing-associated H-X9-DG protein
LPTAGGPGGDFDFGTGLEYRPRWYELLGAEVHLKAYDHVPTNEDDTWKVNDNSIFLCPAVPEFNNSRNYVYGYNYQFLGNARPVMSGAKTNICYPVKVSKIAGSQTVLCADCLGTAAGKPTADRTGYGYDGSHDPFGVLNKGWCLDPPRMTSTSDYADPEHRNPPDRSGPDPRHNGKANVLFCDGHVQLMSPREMGYVVLADGSMPINGAGANNTLFSGRGTDADPPSVFGQ